MAKINVKNHTIELERYEYSPDYEIQITYKNSECEDGMLKRATIVMNGINSRQKCTFDEIQKNIDEYFEKYDRNVQELKSIRVIEKQTIKNEPFDS